MFNVMSPVNVRTRRTYSLFTTVLIDCSAPALFNLSRAEALAGLPLVVLQFVMFYVKLPLVIKSLGSNTKVFIFACLASDGRPYS
jgi:hypothetical protein